MMALLLQSRFCFVFGSLCFLAANLDVEVARAVRAIASDDDESPSKCLLFTGKSCRLMPCAQKAFATCSGGAGGYKCACGRGLCAQADGRCGFSSTTWQTQLVRNSEFPAEIRGGRREIETAFCFSGGGSRAGSVSIGVVRALETLHLVPHIDVFSAVSGATMSLIPYIFADPSRFGASEPLVGHPTDPATLDYEKFTKEVPPLARPYANRRGGTYGMVRQIMSMIKHMLRDAKLEAHDAEFFWRAVMRKVYLEPWNLDSNDALMAASIAHVQRVKEANPVLRDVQFYTPREDAPLFLLGVTLLGLDGEDHTDAIPIDISAGYTGTPVLYDVGDSRDRHFALASSSSKLERLVGGGFVETFAFGGKAPEDLSGSVPAPFRPFSLGDAMSMTTYADFLPKEDLFRWRPNYTYWPMKEGAVDRMWSFGDGGFSDDSGLLTVLRRGAKRVGVVFSAVDIQVDNKMCLLWDKIQDGQMTQEHLKTYNVTGMLSSTLRAIHGYGSDDGKWHLTHNHVFKREEFFRLGCEFSKLSADGAAMVSRKSISVLPNPYWGIKGDYEVDIMLLHLSKFPRFEAKLPPKIRGLLSDNFPFDVDTTLHLKPFEINIFADQMYEAAISNADVLTDLFGSKPS
eukprot:TRINITY_DN26666_c1_g1_i1.p1 TRINITY_DN26666_c1_g1~~TRINITY_DN26666_c1_g1_i1.p1  ORF type:complete len:628 (-),score=82.50 TRINITY_DN26666_c1_g1_i1:150-2033(-)